VAGKVLRWFTSSAGSNNDTYSRLLEPFYERAIGAEMVIENVSGGAGIVRAITIKEAAPDGLTQGIIDGPGLLVAALTGQTEAPNPATDFTLLGRLYRSQQIWATGSNSPLKTIDDVFAESAKRPILFGLNEVGGTSFVNIAVTSFLLGVDAAYIAGFSGGRELALAAVRGELDCITRTFESIQDLLETGDLRALLQVSVEPISSHPSLEGVPLLGGDDGLAARRAAELDRDVEEAKADASALASLLGAGELVAAPLGLEESLHRCLEQGLHEALAHPEFVAAVAASNRPLDVARGDVALADLQAAVEKADKFLPIIQEAIKKVRG
jgi:hypothetical protein